jgi:formate dehydrogenase subunit gamma
MGLIPGDGASEPGSAERLREIAEELKHLEGPLLPILHAINDRFGHVDADAVRIVAEVLNLTRAEVHGVVGFYHDFRRAPHPGRTVRICRAEACQSRGADRLFAEVEAACTAEGLAPPEPVYCLGNCALSPAALIDGRLHGRLDAGRVLALARG